MENTTKFLGAFLLLTLLVAHIFLIGFFFAPSHKLMASVLGPEYALIESSDIPEPVQGFLVDNNVDIKSGQFTHEEFFPGFMMGMLELRSKKFMSDEEKLVMNLNMLHFGEDIIGIEAASQYYFKKPVSDITDTQWITLINLQKIFSK